MLKFVPYCEYNMVYIGMEIVYTFQHIICVLENNVFYETSWPGIRIAGPCEWNQWYWGISLTKGQ